MTLEDVRARLSAMPLARRLAVSVAFFGFVAIAAAGAVGYGVLVHQLDERAAEELRGRAELTRHLLAEMARPESVPAGPHRFADLLIGHDELHLALVDANDGRVLAGFSPVALESARRFAGAHRPVIARWQFSDRRLSSLAAEGPTADGQPVAFVLTLDRQADRRLLADYVRTLLLVLPLILAGVAAGAWSVAHAGLAPLLRFARVAGTISSDRLHHRVDPSGLPAELRMLAHALNAMLDRIDDGMTRLAQFSGDLAHEMRTPVATLLGRTQVSLSRSRTVDELRDVLAANVEELERLARLIGDMLLLARTEQGAAALERTEVRLGIEAQRVAEFLAGLAEERGILVEVRGDAAVQADRILVQRAITNLLSNALRHANAGSTVGLSVGQTDGTASVAVTNRGQPLPADQFERIFERFVRLDSARARTDGGTGLGLAIVKSIMQAHGGQVRVDGDAAGETTFTLVFPAVFD